LVSVLDKSQKVADLLEERKEIESEGPDGRRGEQRAEKSEPSSRSPAEREGPRNIKIINQREKRRAS